MTELELSRRERKKEETKERIYKAAFELFKERGFEATTIDDISEAADVAKGTFFNYFPRKEALLAYRSAIWSIEAREKAEELLGSDDPSPEKLIEMFASFAATYEADRELSRHEVQEWARRSYSGCDDACQQWHELGVEVFKRMQRLGKVRPDVDPERAEYIASSVWMGTMMMWLECPESSFSLQEELRKRLTLVFYGMTPR